MKILVTGGRSFSALGWLQCLQTAGHEVVVCDSVPYYLCQAYAVQSVKLSVSANGDRRQFQQSLFDIIEEFHVDVLVPVNEETLHVSNALGSGNIVTPAGRRVFVFASGVQLLDQLHNKFTFNQLLCKIFPSSTSRNILLCSNSKERNVSGPQSVQCFTVDEVLACISHEYQKPL